MHPRKPPTFHPDIDRYSSFSSIFHRSTDQHFYAVTFKLINALWYAKYSRYSTIEQQKNSWMSVKHIHIWENGLLLTISSQIIAVMRTRRNNFQHIKISLFQIAFYDASQGKGFRCEGHKTMNPIKMIFAPHNNPNTSMYRHLFYKRSGRNSEQLHNSSSLDVIRHCEECMKAKA